MAKSMGRKTSETAAPPLEPGDYVRFRASERSNWRLAKVRRLNDDGSVDLTNLHSGGTHTVWTDRVQREVKGARGAMRWETMA